VNLDELRVILLSERESGRLVQIPHDLFASARKSLEELYSDLHACSDPFSDEAQVLIQRINAMRETLLDLFHIRAEKILSLARTQEDGHYLDRDEMKRLLPEEREMCEVVVQALGQARCRLIGGTAAGAPTPGGGEEICTPAEEAGGVSGPAPFAVTRVLQDVEPFMGVDGRIYDLRREDIVTLPERNADVLCERNILLNLKMPEKQ